MHIMANKYSFATQSVHTYIRVFLCLSGSMRTQTSTNTHHFGIWDISQQCIYYCWLQYRDCGSERSKCEINRKKWAIWKNGKKLLERRCLTVQNCGAITFNGIITLMNAWNRNCESALIINIDPVLSISHWETQLIKLIDIYRSKRFALHCIYFFVKSLHLSNKGIVFYSIEHCNGIFCSSKYILDFPTATWRNVQAITWRWV